MLKNFILFSLIFLSTLSANVELAGVSQSCTDFCAGKGQVCDGTATTQVPQEMLVELVTNELGVSCTTWDQAQSLSSPVIMMYHNGHISCFYDGEALTVSNSWYCEYASPVHENLESRRMCVCADSTPVPTTTTLATTTSASDPTSMPSPQPTVSTTETTTSTSQSTQCLFSQASTWREYPDAGLTDVAFVETVTGLENVDSLVIRFEFTHGTDPYGWGDIGRGIVISFQSNGNEVHVETIAAADASAAGLTSENWGWHGVMEVSGYAFTFNDFDFGAGGSTHDMYILNCGSSADSTSMPSVHPTASTTVEVTSTTVEVTTTTPAYHTTQCTFSQASTWVEYPDAGLTDVAFVEAVTGLEMIDTLVVNWEFTHGTDPYGWGDIGRGIVISFQSNGNEVHLEAIAAADATAAGLEKQGWGWSGSMEVSGYSLTFDDFDFGAGGASHGMYILTCAHSTDSAEPTSIPTEMVTTAEVTCPSGTWVAVEECMTDELCQGICSGTPDLCPPKACECLEEFVENPGFCCGGSCHDDYAELWTFNFHNAFWNSYDDNEPVQWDQTTQGCQDLCHQFDRCDAFTVVDNVKCELVSGFDHFEPATDCETCFVKANLEKDQGECSDDGITVVDIQLGNWQDGEYFLENGIWKNDHPLKLHCCEATGVWGVTKLGDTCVSSYDEYTWNVGSCCVKDLIDHLAFFTTTQNPSQAPSAMPTDTPLNTCCTLVEMSGLEVQSERNGIYQKEVGLYHDEWPVYKSTHHVEAPEQYLYFSAASGANGEWLIGSDYESPLGFVVSSNVNKAAGCPSDFDYWTHVNSEGGFTLSSNAKASCFTPPPMA